jgi:hypothetical protein
MPLLTIISNMNISVQDGRLFWVRVSNGIFLGRYCRISPGESIDVPVKEAARFKVE